MDDQEIESVTEAKAASARKKVDVLAAMAKYDLKKQQERQEAMKSSAKQQVSPAKQEQQEQSTKGWKRNFNSHNNATNQTKHHSEIDPENELKIGITEYVNRDQGFSGILKQRYSDFQVHEIDTDGNVVHLTGQDIPLVVEKSRPDVSSALSDEQLKAIEEVFQSEEPKTYEIDVTNIDKEERNKIHLAVRSKYENILSNSEHVDGRTILKIFKAAPGKMLRRERSKREGAPYTQFVMYKENMSTMEAVSSIARRLRMRPNAFMTAGTKDKRAITSQLVSVKHVDPKKLLESMRDDTKVAVGNFSYKYEPLQLGHLKGNRFVIALRNVIGEPNQIERKLESLKENGFINYYGAQRFGTRHVPTHAIGKQLLLGEWQKAIDLILEPPEIEGRFQQDLTLARKEYRTSRDAKKACQLLQKSHNSIEGQLLSSLRKYGKDLVGALNTIPRNLRLTYIHAYQSLLWNTVVSKRIAKFGLKPILGDLVYVPGSEGDDMDAEIANNENVPDELGSSDKEGDGDKTRGRAQRNQRKVMTINESNIDEFSMKDVLLPLPGFDIEYPANEVANWYTELLAEDGLSESDFKRSVKTYNLGGAYRLVLSKPYDVKWKFVRYDDPSLSLITSDWDRLQNVDPAANVPKDGAFLGLVLEFSLPSSSYATMALREITKMDMSAEFQTSLNDAGTNNKQPPVATLPTSETVEAAATDEPEMKRIKQEGEIKREEESVTSGEP